ncbi:unnamed protein product [Amoebophrya sp. A120]|nr:unnamed protein product [Amoebophrya sp. A120]|eukprot:GSA120T00001921001.1
MSSSSSVAVVNGLSVVIPTYNEVENVVPLCERLFATLRKELPELPAELLLVDDESAGSEETEKLVTDLAAKKYPIRIHRRYRSEGRGLSSAVMLGFQKAKYDVMLSMDADLQHEPESVPAVAAPVLDRKVDFTVGCRYMKQGGIAFNWSVKRQVLSLGATALAWGLCSSRDPMSGFFCVRKGTLQRGIDQINPIGFKIGLEIMARCRCSVQDVPIMFQERLHGESKLSAKQNIEYIQQLLGLYWAAHGFKITAVVFFVLFVIVKLNLSFFFHFIRQEEERENEVCNIWLIRKTNRLPQILCCVI